MTGCTGLPDNDLDRATYLGNDADTSSAPRLPHSEREAAIRRLETSANPYVQRIGKSLRGFYGGMPGAACTHGIDTTHAACGQCWEAK